MATMVRELAERARRASVLVPATRRERIPAGRFSEHARETVQRAVIPRSKRSAPEERFS